VAEVSRAIAKNPKDVFKYTIKGNSVAVISDGSAILGLGNLGALAAIPVMEGKCALFKKFANIDAFPICLNTQDPEEIIKVVKMITPVFGAINLEDISAPRCFYIEERLRALADIPVMHDDQHGTAVVVLAGLINALKLRRSKVQQVKIVINGAGSAGLAIVDLLLKYGFKNIIVNDSQGIIFEGRADLNPEKQRFAKLTNRALLQGDLAQSLIGTDIFIGVSKARVLTQEMIKTMNPKPIIFALANPEPEIMPELAKAAGAFVVATGRSDYPNQVNNALAFPGIFRGALDNKIKQFNDRMFIKSAEAIASAVKKVTADKIIPSPFEKGLAQKIAKVIK
jgi:malate dehydrogenase (oxaloacetate-decarboxylating)